MRLPSPSCDWHFCRHGNIHWGAPPDLWAWQGTGMGHGVAFASASPRFAGADEISWTLYSGSITGSEVRASQMGTLPYQGALHVTIAESVWPYLLKKSVMVRGMMPCASGSFSIPSFPSRENDFPPPDCPYAKIPALYPSRTSPTRLAVVASYANR